MIESGWGRIVNISSGVVEHLGAMIGRGKAYVTARPPCRANTLNLAAELAGTGVTVNATEQGGVETDMQRASRPDRPDAARGPAAGVRLTHDPASGSTAEAAARAPWCRASPASRPVRVERSSDRAW